MMCAYMVSVFKDVRGCVAWLGTHPRGGLAHHRPRLRARRRAVQRHDEGNLKRAPGNKRSNLQQRENEEEDEAAKEPGLGRFSHLLIKASEHTCACQRQ